MAPRTTGADLLVLGGTGLAGRSITRAARARGLDVVTLARGGEIQADVRDLNSLEAALARTGPRVIINAAATVSIPQCEIDPADAWLVNARPAALLARYSSETGARLVHLSTDHFYIGDGRRPHSESEPVRLVNEYARTKYAAEALALTATHALVLRTNFVGWPSPHRASFAEWAYDVIVHDRAADLFNDQFVSSIDVWSLADAVLDMTAGDARGVVNLAASEVFSKAEFVFALARAVGRSLSGARERSLAIQGTPRADSLGLDVSSAERILKRPLPKLDETVANLVAHLEDWGIEDAMAH